MRSIAQVFRSTGRISAVTAGFLSVVYVLLLIPEPYPTVPPQSGKEPFVWDQDRLWYVLEEQFDKARREDSATVRPQVDSSLANIHALLDSVAAEEIRPDDPRWDKLENAFFFAAPKIAVCTNHVPEYIDLYSRLRRIVKEQSRHWDLQSPETRARIYRLLYGGRAAVEEVILQAPVDAAPSLIHGTDEPSATPAANLLGITVHSGDILLSRGGAPTSALIARGNDFPGNFSHVALVYVDGRTHRMSIIESHIEKGVAVASPEEYLADLKLRVMVLRLRSDLPQLMVDPLLPHRAAGRALAEAQARHIPYDFAMDFADDSKLFCSEVASAPYREQGVQLWMGLSHISSPGLRSWLAGFGVRHFVTQEPSDLEYDPQLRVVAEWHDPQRLYQDHLDNAVIDAMLESADTIPQLPHTWCMLPPVRLTKGYSMLLNAFGKIGPVPEGMSATAALRNVAFSAWHAAIKAELMNLAEECQQRQSYMPPYWVLVHLARNARDMQQ